MPGHCNPIDHPVCLAIPERRAASRWAEHIPFAMWLTSVLRPGVMVELGTFRGTSYCGFCKSGIDAMRKTGLGVARWRLTPAAVRNPA